MGKNKYFYSHEGMSSEDLVERGSHRYENKDGSLVVDVEDLYGDAKQFTLTSKKLEDDGTYSKLHSSLSKDANLSANMFYAIRGAYISADVPMTKTHFVASEIVEQAHNEVTGYNCDTSQELREDYQEVLSEIIEEKVGDIHFSDFDASIDLVELANELGIEAEHSWNGNNDAMRSVYSKVTAAMSDYIDDNKSFDFDVDLVPLENFGPVQQRPQSHDDEPKRAGMGI